MSQAGFDGGSDPWFRPRGERAFEDAKSEEISTGRARKYPPELIERGVRLALESGRSIAYVARDLGIESETLRKRLCGLRSESESKSGAC